MVGKHHPTASQCGVIGEGFEYIEHPTTLSNGSKQGARLLVPLIMFEGLNSGMSHAHGCFPYHLRVEQYLLQRRL